MHVKLFPRARAIKRRRLYTGIYLVFASPVALHEVSAHRIAVDVVMHAKSIDLRKLPLKAIAEFDNCVRRTLTTRRAGAVCGVAVVCGEAAADKVVVALHGRI